MINAFYLVDFISREKEGDVSAPCFITYVWHMRLRKVYHPLLSHPSNNNKKINNKIYTQSNEETIFSFSFVQRKNACTRKNVAKTISNNKTAEKNVLLHSKRMWVCNLCLFSLFALQLYELHATTVNELLHSFNQFAWQINSIIVWQVNAFTES